MMEVSEQLNGVHIHCTTLIGKYSAYFDFIPSVPAPHPGSMQVQ